MKANKDLARWLASRDLQARSSDAVRIVAQRWRDHPLMHDLRQSLDTLAHPAIETIRPMIERFFSRAADLDAFMAEMIAAAASDPFAQPPFTPIESDIHSALSLFEHPLVSITLGVSPVDALAAKKSAKRGPTSIGLTGFYTLLHLLKAGGTTFSFWEGSAVGPGFVGAESENIRLRGRRQLEDRETLVIDGRSQSFVIEHAQSDLVYLQAIVRAEAAPLAVEYDSASLSYVGASSSDEEASRIQMMATLLRLMDRNDAVPFLVEALQSPHFYTRWHIMRELLALDAAVAEPWLRRMAVRDPHADVRDAASATIAVFFAGEAVTCPA